MGKGKRPPVLIVDDDADICLSLRWLLEDEGYEVLWTGDGTAILPILHSADRPFVVLLDYLMPEVDGREVLERVAADPFLATTHAFLLMTAQSRTLPPRLRQLLTALAIPVAQKPFDIAELLAKVEAAARGLQARWSRGR